MSAPAYSVVVATFDRRDVLCRTLRALLAQKDAPPFEIVVADDGSRDGSAEAAERLLAGGGVPYVVSSAANAGQAAARNRAIGIARGTYLLFLNDDTIPADDLLARHAAARDVRLDAGPGVCILGALRTAPSLPREQIAHLYQFDYRWIEGREEVPYLFFWTCNLSVPRAFLLAHGLFDENFRALEDLELGWRLRQRGLRIFFEPRALADHEHPMTLSGICREMHVRGRMLRRYVDLHGMTPGLADYMDVGAEQGGWKRRARQRAERVLWSAWTAGALKRFLDRPRPPTRLRQYLFFKLLHVYKLAGFEGRALATLPPVGA